MTIPAAMMIESALEMVLHENPRDTALKRRELATAMGETVSPDFIQGYLLGVKTVEVVLLMRGDDL